MKYSQHFQTRKTPQSQPIPGTAQVANNAGGFAWAVDDWTRLDRFLILGSEGGTYYVFEQALTVQNAESVLRCIKADGQRTVARIEEISVAGRAPKNDPALFALAMAAAMGDESTKRGAWDALPRVARIGTHLFHFVREYHAFRGWSRASRNGIAAWYNSKSAKDVAFQAVKYQQRDGWSHKDLLRLAHPQPQDAGHQDIYKWIAGKGAPEIGSEDLRVLDGYERAQSAGSPGEVALLIRDYGLTWEMVSTQVLNAPVVWEALLDNMPMMAMIRNLGKMTHIELVKPMSNAVTHIAAELHNQEHIKKARVHPMAILLAMRTYQQGHGERGKLSWEPVSQIVDALDDAFYLSFANVEPTGKRLMLALDVSGSMGGSTIAGSSLTAREGSAAMALVTAKTEPNYLVTAFSCAGYQHNNGISILPISPRQRLTDAVRQVSDLPFGGTDCALPMLYATIKNLDIDTFIIYTDSETWAGDIHPSQALQEYRQKRGIAAKLIVVGMTSNGFSIADPNDAGMLDCVGFDSAVPTIIADFVKGA